MESLLSELENVRTNGWAETRQEIIDGISSIGVGFSGVAELSGIALSISYPIANLTEEQQENVKAGLLQAAATLSRRIGDKNYEAIKSR